MLARTPQLPRPKGATRNTAMTSRGNWRTSLVLEETRRRSGAAVLPSADVLALGFRFIARRRGFRGEPDLRILELAIAEVAALSSRPDLEPAAIFFAFARRPRAFPGAWRVLPIVLAINAVRGAGGELDPETVD